MKILTAHQPVFAPYMGLLDKIDKADVLVLLDDVEYTKGGYINRNKILIDGEPKWLTLPVEKAPRDTKIGDIKVSRKNLDTKSMLNTIRHAYSKAPFYEEGMEFIETVIRTLEGDLLPYSLERVNVVSLFFLIEKFDLDIKVYFSSDYTLSNDSTERLIDLCGIFEGETYLSGANGKTYLDIEKFKNVGVEFQDFKQEPYSQLGTSEFIPNMSVIDYIMNNGYNKEW